MTYEQALYYKLLLICGYREDLDRFIENALCKENPMSDIVLDLSFCQLNNKDTLCKLNNYICSIPDCNIDYNITFTLILSFLREKYYKDGMSLARLTDLMSRISIASDKYFDDEPWKTMYLLRDCYTEAKDGIFDMDSVIDVIESFLKNGTTLSE